MSGRVLKVSTGEKIFNKFNYVVVTLFMLICIYPFYYVVIYSISDAVEAAKGVYLFPVRFDFTTYLKFLHRRDIGNALFVSTARTGIYTILCVLISSLFAFMLTKREMILRKFVYRFVIITMYMNAGLIPWYITMKSYGLKDNFLLYILPGVINAFFIILIKTYIEQLPASLQESATIDGAGIFTVFFKIILPLSKPIIATTAVYAAVGAWNTWIDNYLLVHNPKLQTMQLILYNYLNEAQSLATSMKNTSVTGGTSKITSVTPESVRMAITVISVVPILMVYPFLQRYFVKGIMMGAIKG